MIDDLKKYFDQVKAFKSYDLEKIEAFRINFLGKKGILFKPFRYLKNEK